MQLDKIALTFRKQQIFDKILFITHYSKKQQLQYEKYIKIKAKQRIMKVYARVVKKIKMLVSKRKLE